MATRHGRSRQRGFTFDSNRHGKPDRDCVYASRIVSVATETLFLPALVYYFGLRYTVVLSIYILLFSVVSGMVFERLVPDKMTQ